MRDPLGGRLVDREADALEAAAVHEHDPRLVLRARRLRPDRIPAPDRHRARSRSPSTKRIRPSIRCLDRNARALAGGVARRLDGDRQRRHVVAELVQRALHLLRRRRAGVVAVRVEERDDHGLAAEVAHRDRLARARRSARTRAPGRRRAAASRRSPRRPRRATPSLALDDRVRGRADREQAGQEQRQEQARVHAAEGTLAGMRALVGTAAAALALVPASAHAQGPAEPYDGTIPFDCVLQQAGTEAEFPDPDADPFCVEYDKRHQNVTRGRRRRVPLARARARRRRVAEVLLLPARPLGRLDRAGRRPHGDLLVGRLVLLRQGEGRGRRLRRELHVQQPERRPDGAARVPGGVEAVLRLRARRLPRDGHRSTPIRRASRRPRRTRPTGRSPSRARRRAAAPRPRASVGRSIGGLRLGATRERDASTANGEPMRRKRGFLRYCIIGGGKYMVGFGRERRRVPAHEQPRLRRERGQAADAEAPGAAPPARGEGALPHLEDDRLGGAKARPRAARR